MAEVEYERRGNVAIVTLNRPEARNAVNPAVSKGMADILDKIEGDDEIRVVVLTGAGDVFCAGADLKIVAQGRVDEIKNVKGAFAGIVKRDFPKPIIAAVNGAALAGGFEIVLSCDVVVAADTARFGIPEASRGLLAGGGGLIRLPRRIPVALALEMAMTGDPIDAQRALQLGLVNKVVPRHQLIDGALELAERISRNSPIAVRNSRKMVRESPTLSEADAWTRCGELVAEVMASGDSIEGATAFAEKRDPVWMSS
jgi:enoyl-CoA hydratase